MTSDRLTPVAAADRHLQLDVLRGLGVMGILAVNIAAFALPFEAFMSPKLSPHGFDADAQTAWWTVRTFFEFKFVTLFSMLFGVSLFLIGGERSDLARGALLRRRLFWLAVFGLIHGLAVWYGDILLLYAWAGLFMMLARSWSARRLFWTGLTIVLLGSLIAVGPMIALEYAPATVQKDVQTSMLAGSTAESARAAVEAMRSGLLPAMKENFNGWLFVQASSAFMFVFRTVALMMIGLSLFKWGFLIGKSPVWVYLLSVAAGAASLWAVGTSAQAILASGYAFPQSYGRYAAANEFLSLVISLGYASTLILLIKLAVMRSLLRPLAAVGQMAFTNYLTQSLILTTIFWSGRGLGLFGAFDRDALWLFVFGVWALQLVWSPLWLSRFRMGPLEWVGRRLTYGKGLEAKAA